MSTKLKKRAIWLGAILAAAAGGVAWWQAGAKAKGEAPPPTALARKGDLSVRVSATGAVEPEYTVEIKSKASGVVEKVTVQEGDRVTRGQLLVRIDPIVERRRVTQAVAELRMAEAQLASVRSKRDFAEGQLKRDEGLLKKGLVSAEAVETLRKELAVLRGDAQVAAAQVLRAGEALKEARDRLVETEIRAPIAGTVLERLVQVGQIVASGTNAVNGGTTLLKVADLGRLFVRVKVDEADVAKVASGQKVRITADALPGRAFGGRVVRVAPQGKVESNVTVFEVLVEADAEGRQHLRPMMTANVDVLVGERKGVVLVPARAVRQRPEGKLVIVAGAGQRAVQVGLTQGDLVEITAGLAEGERVVLPGAGARASGAERGRGPTMGQMRRAMGGGR